MTLDLIKCMEFHYPRLPKYDLPMLFYDLMDCFHKELLKGGLKISLSDLSIIELNDGKYHRYIDDYGLIVDGIEDMLKTKYRQEELKGV